MPRSAALPMGMLAAAALIAAQPGYIDSATCAGCHSEIARNYAQTGMGRSLRAAGKVTPPGSLPQFDGSSFLHETSRERFTFTLRDGVPWIRRSQPGLDGAETNVFEERVDYVLGSGNHAISYLHRTPDNRLTEFPVSWYPENGGHWAMSPGYDRPDHSGFSREVNFACMQCHYADPKSAAGSEIALPGENTFPAALPEGIDCQRCHGPGRDHANAAAGGESARQIRDTIVNPARLDYARQEEVCFQCHLETTSGRLPASQFRPGRSIFSYRPGEPLSDFVLAFDRAPGAEHADSVELVSEPYRLVKSSCRLAGGKPLTCTTCHDPHLPLSREESVRKTESLCVTCHPARDNRHPARQDCVVCHMPRTQAVDVIHAAVTDHFIARPHSVASPAAEASARNTKPYAGEVTLYYPASLPRDPSNDLSLAIAQVQSNPVEALRRLNRLASTGTAQPPEAAAEIGRAFLLLSQPQQAINWYRQALAESRDNPLYLAGLGRAQQAAGRSDLAAETLLKVAGLEPGNVDVLLSLGQAYARQGNFTAAIRTLRDAVSQNPESSAAFNDLGSALLGAGNFREAEDALRSAVRIRPESGSLRMNLADAFIKEGKLRDAREQLEEVIRIGGDADTAESVWCSALVVTGSTEHALKVWTDSFAVQTAGAHNNLGTVFASENNIDGAIREYRLAVEGDPQSALAQFNLGLTLNGRGLRDEAMPFLKKAAESTNPRIRDAARALVERQ